MDILDLTAFSLICSSCGGHYQVPLKQRFSSSARNGTNYGGKQAGSRS